MFAVAGRVARAENVMGARALRIHAAQIGFELPAMSSSLPAFISPSHHLGIVSSHLPRSVREIWCGRLFLSGNIAH
jgi:hypothetical protein